MISLGCRRVARRRRRVPAINNSRSPRAQRPAKTHPRSSTRRTPCPGRVYSWTMPPFRDWRVALNRIISLLKAFRLSRTDVQLGSENTRLAYPLTGLGTAYHNLGQFAVAESFYQRALCVRREQGSYRGSLWSRYGCISSVGRAVTSLSLRERDHLGRFSRAVGPMALGGSILGR